MRNILSALLPAFLLALLAACSDGSDNIIGREEDEHEEEEVVVSELQQETIDLSSAAQPAHTPGTEGVTIDNDKLLQQFGGDEINLNRARYTRYFLSDQAAVTVDAILVLVPGFEGGASNFYLLAENLLRRAKQQSNLTLEVWAIDRRSSFLEDTIGLDMAEDLNDPLLGLDFLFGEELGLELSEALRQGPNRRAVFYNSNADTAYMAQWTALVHSQDIDAVVKAALAQANNANVFLGGHSAGTGFTARYAATDFNLTGDQPEPGYRKVRGLILLEGGGSGLATPADDVTLDLIEARFDGGLYGAIRDQAPRCIDGITECSIDSAISDCAAFSNTSCVEPVSAYAEIAGLLSPQLLAVSEVNALDAIQQGDGVQSILQADQNGIPGNSAVNQVPELNVLVPLVGNDPASSANMLGNFIDDDGLAAAVASFVATSVGSEGPTENGVATWTSRSDGLPEILEDNGPPPTTLEDIGVWGVEVEASDLEGRMMPMFYRGATNFSEWYYASSGLDVTRGLGLDTTALSAPPPEGRGRSDIANRTEAANIDIPVIGFGGSNGLLTVPARWLGFAEAIGTCRAASCDGATPRILDRNNPSEAFPTYGDMAGGFEVYMSEGYAHLDVLTADDDETNNVIGPLLDFLERNLQ